MKRGGVKSGFTLIELLVVISIIALLLSILMPSLNKAKSMARRLLCGNNIRQLGMASFVYATQNKDKLPPGGWGPQNGSWTTFLFVIPNTYTKDALVKCGANRDVFQCPSSGIEKASDSDYLWNLGLMTYSYLGGQQNRCPDDLPNQYSPRKGTMYPNRTSDLKSSVVLFADTIVWRENLYWQFLNHLKKGAKREYNSTYLLDTKCEPTKFVLGGNFFSGDGSTAWANTDDIDWNVYDLYGGYRSFCWPKNKVVGKAYPFDR